MKITILALAAALAAAAPAAMAVPKNPRRVNKAILLPQPMIARAAAKARPRCEMAFFSSAESSANDLS